MLSALGRQAHVTAGAVLRARADARREMRHAGARACNKRDGCRRGPATRRRDSVAMNSNPTPPRDLSPMWLDLSHVISGLTVPPAPPRPADAQPRRGPPRDDLPDDGAAEPSRAARWCLLAAAQLAGACATAALLKLMGLSPV
jgi:hypothetical protein